MDMAMAEEGGKQMENTNKIDLIEWIQKAFHVVHKTWKALILLVAFCSMVFIGRAVLNYSPVYESKVTFSVIKEYNGNSNFSYNKEATDRLSSSFLTIIQSDLMISTICEDLQVSSIPATFRVERIESTNLFSVYATSENPEDAKAVLDSLTRNYNQISRVALNDAVLNVIEEAELPASPANSIDYVHEISRGVMVGIAGYLVIAVLYAAVRRTILRPEDIKVYLHSHCLCAVPKVKVLKGKPVRICDQIAHVDHLKDSFHKVRLEMENAAKEKDQRVFMVTSASAHEGKSMAAANLALSLANKGHRVLLLDFDLRNPTQMKTFDLKAEDADRITLSDTEFFSFHQVVHDTLDVVSVSAVQDQAAEILGGEEVKNWMKQMREAYDYVLIDTPPIGIIADSAVTAEYADSVIVVIREDYVSVNAIRDVLQTLQHINHNVLGCMLNQCRSKGRLSSYYGYRLSRYGYGYGYGYHYGYGYGNKKSRS